MIQALFLQHNIQSDSRCILFQFFFTELLAETKDHEILVYFDKLKLTKINLHQLIQ